MLWEKREQIIITSSFKAYLYAAVRNYSIDYIRSRESKVILMDPVGGSVDEPYVDITESAGIESAYDQQYRQLEQMVSVLPQRRKKIFLLYRNGHGISDIATILGLSKKTVRNCIGKAVKQLQRLVINYNHLPLYILFCISFTVGLWSLWAI